MTVIETLGREYVAVEDANTTEMYPCAADEANVFGSDDCYGTTQWRTECGAMLEDEPELLEVWQCEECATIFEDREDARECCRD